jgi:hypothetical protein
MFGAAYYLPFVVFGSTTVLWVCMMLVAFSVRGTQLARQMNLESRASAAKVASGLALYARHATFVSAENRVGGIGKALGA